MTTPTSSQVEAAAEAAWNLHATRKWHEIPEDWKQFYRENAAAALLAAGKVTI